MVAVFVEYATSGRSHCQTCGKSLKKEALRLGANVGYFGKAVWYHTECFILAYKPFAAHHGAYGYRLDEFYGYCQLTKADQTFVSVVLKKYLERIAPYKLSKHIFQMNVSELRGEMRKRKLRVSGKKLELTQRLRDYLQTDWCMEYQRKQDEKCITGFCRKFEKKNKMNIPIVLRGVIRKFYPANTL